jgi:glycosyltransferase involved in cell wall biosynthesis
MPADAPPLLSIVISTRRQEITSIEKTLRSILSSDLSSAEVIIVNQLPETPITELIQNLDDQTTDLAIRCINIRQQGVSRGRNEGWRGARGDWVLFLDDDVILPKNFYSVIRQRLQEDRSRDISFFGKVLTLEGGKNYLKRSILRTRSLHLFNFDSVCSVGLIFNRRILQAMGGFDTEFGTGGRYGAAEESDLIIRMLDLGYDFEYLPEFRVYHPPSSVQPQKSRLYGSGLGALYRKHMRPWRARGGILALKFLLEIAVRCMSALVLLPVDRRRSVSHLEFVRGLLEGFIAYASPCVTEEGADTR